MMGHMLTQNISEKLQKPGQIQGRWREILEPELNKDYMHKLRIFLQHEYSLGKTIYPHRSDYFNAFNSTPFEMVKVVVIGQDPYHGPGQAHGMCFSVKEGVAFPPSLKNIFQELHSDLNLPIPKSGCLESWAKQGVFLLNSVLTVEQGKAGSHQGKGWELFTDVVVKELNDRLQSLVFVLWGSYAQKKASFVDRKKHFVIECVHPSPLSSYRGFFGSKPFSKINQYLLSKGLSPIDWRI